MVIFLIYWQALYNTHVYLHFGYDVQALLLSMENNVTNFARKVQKGWITFVHNLLKYVNRLVKFIWFDLFYGM